MYLWTPRTSYRSCRSRVARRSKRKLDRQRFVPKAHQCASSVVVLALIFRSHHKPSPPSYQNWAPLGKHGGAVAAKPFCVKNAAVAGLQETLAVTPRKFPLCSTNSHPAVQAVGLAVLIRSAGQVARYLVARGLEVHFQLPERSREVCLVRLVHHRDDATSPRTHWCPVIFSTSSL